MTQIMKIREQCYKGTLKEIPMKVAKDHLAMENAIPSSKDTYKQRNKIGEISSTKAAHLYQMYSNYVPEEHRQGQVSPQMQVNCYKLTLSQIFGKI